MKNSTGPFELAFNGCLSLPQSQALGIWEEIAERKLGPITNIATDGDAERRRLLAEEYKGVHLKELPGTWWKALEDISLFDKNVGPGGVTQHFDWKHMVKRMRQRDKCKTKGSQIGEGGGLNAQTLSLLFNTVFKPQDWTPLFQPEDR